MGSLVLVCAALAAAAADAPAPVAVRVPEGPHPRVYVTADELPALRARAETQPWAVELKRALLDEAAALAAEPLDIPREGGQWTHWYSCKKDGGPLKAESPTRHVCRTCGEAYSGPPYDQVYVTHRHGHWLRGVETLGLAHMLDPRPAFAEKMRAILLEYASFYETLPLHDVNNAPDRGARLLSQTLDESVLLCQTVLGYDLAHNAPCFSPEDHAAIRDGLILPMVKTIQANPRAISNWQSWHNAAVGCAGLLLGDAELVDWAVNGRNGFLYQMGKSLFPGGMWYEECPSYHFYALSAHVYLLEAAARAGMDLYAVPVVKGMFDAPLRQVLPDLTFVPFHDSDRISILSQRQYYEIAFARYGDPAYLPLLGERKGVWTFLWGRDTLPAAPETKAAAVSSAGEGEGLAVMRDAANETALYLDYGPGRSGHVQPAKLNMALYAHGDIRFADPGRLPYGNPMHRQWFCQTIAHNTVVVNGTTQKKTHGTLKAFAAGEGHALCRAVCDTAYKGVTLDRTLLLRGNTVVDVFRCASAEEATFDLPLHFAGTLKNEPATEPAALGDKDGYQHLQHPRRCTDGTREFMIATEGDRGIHVRLFGDPEVFLAEGHGEDMKTLWPMLLQRVKGKSACFAAVYQILDADAAPATATARTGKKGMGIQTGDIHLTVGETTTLKLGDKTIPLPCPESPPEKE